MMNEVLRVFVEKKPGFDVAATHMLADIKDNLGIDTLEEVRYFNRYDVQGPTGAEFDEALGIVFSEPNADIVYRERLDLPQATQIISIEYLPGQYDVRADSAAQCVQLLTQKERPLIKTARVVALTGNLTQNQIDKIKNYLINPVESRVAAEQKPKTLEQSFDVPQQVEVLTGFIAKTDEQIAEFHSQLGLAMTVSDLVFCRDYFKNTEKRDPTITEIRVIDTYWSDHCRHTTFLTRLTSVEVEQGGLSAAIEDALKNYLSVREEIFSGKTAKDISLMDMALAGMRFLKKQGKIPDLDESEEINACSIEATVEIDGKPQQWLIQFKNETHNHPTEIEPFGGAATCLGGAIRDPLSGRSYVYQAMRVTGSGDPTIPFEKTIPGKLPSRKITTGAAQGYSSYGNQIGLATGQVTELYDPGYVAKRMEIGAVIGAGPKSNVVREVPAPGDVIVLLGGRTGRDGCGGATGSSKAHTESSIEQCGAEVQKGNPVEERKIQRLFRKAEVSTLIKRCNDFGAGGVCVAIGELADGLVIDLNRVLKKYEGLDGTELAISESQERMAVVLDPADADKFIAAAAEENLEATPVAVVDKTPRLLMRWNGSTIVDISREFLNTNGVTQLAKAVIAAPSASDCYLNAVPEDLTGKDAKTAFLT
ncbi:MAG: phosphoribosylformylglycinamidine synthase, partial [Oscillospiraceae bacterium]|nr:phosphoribosylformylglycinamidine synthase [Oscillospiraceae bacterium]